MGEAGERLACARFCLSAGQQLLSVGIVTEEQGGSWWEKAHLRCAFPMFFPDVPKRLPADALRHWTRRAAEAQSCPRGKWPMSWRSSSSTRLRIVPIPGTVWLQREGMGIVRCGGLHHRKLQGTEQRIVIGNAGQGALESLGHGRVV